MLASRPLTRAALLSRNIQQLRFCLLCQPRLEGMTPKVKKADKIEVAAKAKAAANKKKNQAWHPAKGRKEEVAGSQIENLLIQQSACGVCNH